MMAVCNGDGGQIQIGIKEVSVELLVADEGRKRNSLSNEKLTLINL